MINISDLVQKAKQKGYKEEQAEALVCQDIILFLLSKTVFNKNITIKGGVLMRCISNDARRATLDLDLDLIKYPLTDKGISELIESLNNVDDISIHTTGKTEELKHQDYKGKRVFVTLKDQFQNELSSKIDIGVHKNLFIEQEEYCFDVITNDGGVVLLINSKEQMFVEKMKPLLKFSFLTTRFKDVYDLFYLTKYVNKTKLMKYIKIIVFNDETMKEKSLESIIERLNITFTNPIFINNLNSSNKNWVDETNESVLNSLIAFFKTLKKKKIKEIFCIHCDKETDYFTKKVIREFDVKELKLTVEVEDAICSSCGHAIFVYEVEKRNQIKVFDTYKKKKGLLTTDEIIKIRKKYGLSQKRLAQLICCGEKNIARYENGAVQDQSIDLLIRMLDKYPEDFGLLGVKKLSTVNA